jgi:hypothetical protein
MLPPTNKVLVGVHPETAAFTWHLGRKADSNSMNSKFTIPLNTGKIYHWQTNTSVNAMPIMANKPDRHR